MTTNPTVSRAFDVQAIGVVAHEATTLKGLGYAAVSGYYFRSSGSKTLLTKPIAQALSAAGIIVFAVYENGFPITASYFTTDTANTDAHTAAVRGLDAGQPEGTPIYFAVDYDAEEAHLDAITAYFAEVRRVLRLCSPSYTAGVYGSGMVCRHLSELGLVSHTWLSQSTGFAEYQDWLPKANVVQGIETKVLGLDVDLDQVRGAAADFGGWTVG